MSGTAYRHLSSYKGQVVQPDALLILRKLLRGKYTFGQTSTVLYLDEGRDFSSPLGQGSQNATGRHNRILILYQIAIRITVQL